MDNHLDVYSDQWQFTLSPWGVNMTFQLRPAHPSQSEQGSVEDVATVRMSIEHAKVMLVQLVRAIRSQEEGFGFSYELPAGLLEDMGIPHDEWVSFWH